jgi:CheY-like chemotaxis protein
MTLQALLVSTDDQAAEVLGRVLPPFGIVLDRCSDPETTKTRIQQQKFAALIIDFEDAEAAQEVLQHAKKLGTEPLSIALVADATKVRDILTGGAHFVLYKPLTEEAAKAGLRPAAALLSRERRRAFRVPVQAPVEITLADGRKVDGILLDLSETGMEVLTAEPLERRATLDFYFKLPDGALEIFAPGEVAWANANGQTGVRFVNLAEASSTALKVWLQAATSASIPGPNETVPHCNLTDLSLGGCYVETNAPFPERALIDLCLKTEALEVHTEGMVRVAHPGHGMGVEFPSRTAEQREKVGNLINVLRQGSTTPPELSISPRALVADLTQFEPADAQPEHSSEELEDPLLELLRRGASLQQHEFLSELRKQRNPEDVATA